MKPVLFLALVSVYACASSTPDAGTDAGADAGTDAGADAGADAGTDAGADAGTDAGTDAGVTERRIFVTSSARTANLGGIEGADGLCTSEAVAAGLQGEFKAWISTIESPVAARFVQSAVPYVLVDGTRIADDWADLTDGSLRAIIDLDANGVERRTDVWTGTLPRGLSYADADCDGFTNGLVGSALCGTTQSINANWTANAVPSCDTPLPLFCVEQ